MNTDVWILGLFALVTASLHAWMEIEIEGPDGWAAKLPTKHYDTKLTRLIFGVPITRYHLSMMATVFAFVQLPVLFVSPWSLQYELLVIGFAVLHFCVEDFLWFVFNPAFGIKKFTRENIWWHRRWFLGLPLAYWMCVPVALLLLWTGSA